MSDRTGKSPEPSPSPTHHYLSTSPKKINSPVSSSTLYASASRTLSNSDPNEQQSKKGASTSSSFNLFDSILPRSSTKPLTVNTNETATTKRTILSSSSSSSSTTMTTPSSSLMPNVQLPDQARCLHSYNAIKEDEICVNKGEYVQIVAANQDNRWFVHRDANRTSPAAEGWLPGFVIGLKQPNSISPPSSSLSANSLHQLTTSPTPPHHPTITYESTLPPKPQASTYDKRHSLVPRHCGPELNIPVHDCIVLLGHQLTFQGHVIGNPRPAIVWQHPRGHTLFDDGINIHTHYGDDGSIQLQLLRVSINDAGIFECVATSSRGTVSEKIHVQVRDSIDHHTLEQVRWSSRYGPNDYRELNEIARGRYSIVRHCVHLSTGDPCAAKFISKKFVSHDRALHEYALISSIRSDALLRVFNFIETAAFSIIISELISDGRLFDYVCSKPIINERDIAQYIRQLLDALHYLHRCKIVHLDITPENLLIDLEHDQVKLCDFGDSIRLSNMRYVHRVVGNVEFAAPEVIDGNIAVNYKTDIWSVGVLLYTLLSGLSPFLDETDEQTCANIMNVDYNFPENQFPHAFQHAKILIQTIFVRDLNARPSTSECLVNEWLHRPGHYEISTVNLNNFVERRKSQVKNLS